MPNDQNMRALNSGAGSRGMMADDYATWAGRLSACVRMLLETPDDASMRVAAKALAEYDAYTQARRVRLAEWVDQQEALNDREQHVR